VITTGEAEELGAVRAGADGAPDAELPGVALPAPEPREHRTDARHREFPTRAIP
jgi:hypothetical protein